jgi:hypothetical protein
MNKAFEVLFRPHATEMLDRAADKIDPIIAKHLWAAARRAYRIGLEDRTIISMMEQALNVSDMPHLPATVACCDVKEAEL